MRIQYKDLHIDFKAADLIVIVSAVPTLKWALSVFGWVAVVVAVLWLLVAVSRKLRQN